MVKAENLLSSLLGLLLLAAVLVRAEDEAPVPGFQLSPKPSPELIKYLERCVEKMNPECADEVVGYMFTNTTVTEECCRTLLTMGEECHIQFVRAIFSIPQLKANASLGIPRSKEVWNKCVLDVGAESPSPVEFET